MTNKSEKLLIELLAKIKNKKRKEWLNERIN